jgi:hypothetical protein
MPKARTTKATKATKTSRTTKAKTTKTTTQKGGRTTKATKATKTTKATTQATTTQKGGNTTTSRFFKVVVDGEVFGRFSGSKPKQAANKALTSILRKRTTEKKSTAGNINFSIVECTRGSRKKTYNYVGERQQLTKPVEVNIKGKTVTYRYNNVVRKAQTGGAQVQATTTTPPAQTTQAQPKTTRKTRTTKKTTRRGKK